MAVASLREIKDQALTDLTNDDVKIKFIEENEDIDKIIKNDDIIKLFYEKSYKYKCYSQNWGESKGIDKYDEVCVILNPNTMKLYTNNELMQGGVSLEHRCQFAGHEIDNVNVAIYTKPFGIDELAAAVFPTLTIIAETVAKAISGAPDFEVDFSELIDPM